jgi:hypothetical protein
MLEYWSNDFAYLDHGTTSLAVILSRADGEGSPFI